MLKLKSPPKKMSWNAQNTITTADRRTPMTVSFRTETANDDK